MDEFVGNVRNALDTQNNKGKQVWIFTSHFINSDILNPVWWAISEKSYHPTWFYGVKWFKSSKIDVEDISFVIKLLENIQIKKKVLPGIHFFGLLLTHGFNVFHGVIHGNLMVVTAQAESSW